VLVKADQVLNTPIIGIWATIVASSMTDMLAGLAGLASFRMPPRFSAATNCPAASAMTSAPKTVNRNQCHRMAQLPAVRAGRLQRPSPSAAPSVS
jgi:hypothetical protein